MSLLRLLSEDLTSFIEHQRELMFNERDFQMQLAVYLRGSGHYDDVDVEYFIPKELAKEKGYEWDNNLRLDIVVKKDGKYAVVELKYPTKRIVSEITRFDTPLSKVEIVKNQGAQDIVSYNFWKDVRRMEIIKSLFPDTVEGGFAVMLTNDPYYVRGPREGSICEPFSTADGRSGVCGSLSWLRNTAITKSYRPFILSGSYSVHWHPTTIAGHPFQFTLIDI